PQYALQRHNDAAWLFYYNLWAYIGRLAHLRYPPLTATSFFCPATREAFDQLGLNTPMKKNRPAIGHGQPVGRGASPVANHRSQPGYCSPGAPNSWKICTDFS